MKNKSSDECFLRHLCGGSFVTARHTARARDYNRIVPLPARAIGFHYARSHLQTINLNTASLKHAAMRVW